MFSLMKISRVGYTKEDCRPIYARSSLVLSKASPTSSVDTVVSASSSTTSASINLGKSFEGSDAGSLSPPLSLSSSVGAYKYSGTLSRSCIYDQTKSDVNGDSGSRLARPSAAARALRAQQSAVKKSEVLEPKVPEGTSKMPIPLARKWTGDLPAEAVGENSSRAALEDGTPCGAC
ncbi:hypothetical protein KSP39_PZI007513 [Platanthera zijinensis]|uniref:Uncharacterized protein n=1 Tax=Platanthera zijinensis TaxID=2320716 RepID=A0AAP0G8Q1_9ASPA